MFSECCVFLLSISNGNCFIHGKLFCLARQMPKWTMLGVPKTLENLLPCDSQSIFFASLLRSMTKIYQCFRDLWKYLNGVKTRVLLIHEIMKFWQWEKKNRTNIGYTLLLWPTLVNFLMWCDNKNTLGSGKKAFTLQAIINYQEYKMLWIIYNYFNHIRSRCDKVTCTHCATHIVLLCSKFPFSE